MSCARKFKRAYLILSTLLCMYLNMCKNVVTPTKKLTNKFIKPENYWLWLCLYLLRLTCSASLELLGELWADLEQVTRTRHTIPTMPKLICICDKRESISALPVLAAAAAAIAARLSCFQVVRTHTLNEAKHGFCALFLRVVGAFDYTRVQLVPSANIVHGYRNQHSFLTSQ